MNDILIKIDFDKKTKIKKIIKSSIKLSKKSIELLIYMIVSFIIWIILLSVTIYNSSNLAIMIAQNYSIELIEAAQISTIISFIFWIIFSLLMIGLWISYIFFFIKHQILLSCLFNYFNNNDFFRKMWMLNILSFIFIFIFPIISLVFTTIEKNSLIFFMDENLNEITQENNNNI